MTTSGLATSWEEGDDPLSERAADFFERRRFGEWSNEDQAELDAWLAMSLLHRAAYLRVEGIVAHTEHLVAFDPREFGLGGGGGTKSAYGWLLAPVRTAASMAARYRRLLAPVLSAASIALAALWGGPFIVSLLQPSDRTDSTDVGGRTLLSFADHTQIELNTNTVVRLQMTTAERTVWLDKGEAWFHVAHDAAHPFTVIVGNHRITDLGTEFLIRRDTGDVDVTLLNGRATLSTEGTKTATLNPGEEAIATPTELSVTRKTPQELSDELAWRRGVLVFRHTRLADVVQAFNRYNTVRLAIADPSIADLKIVANVKTDDYESFLQLAEDVFKLRVDRDGGTILISRGQPETTRRTLRVKHDE